MSNSSDIIGWLYLYKAVKDKPSSSFPVLLRVIHPTMTKALTKVIYKPDNTSTNEYMVVVNPDAVRPLYSSSVDPAHLTSLSSSTINGKKEVN